MSADGAAATGESAGTGRRRLEPWRRNLYLLWGILFAAFIGLSLILPFVPLYVRTLGVTDSGEVVRWSGLLLSGPFMVSFLVTPLWGALGDRYGQKMMVVRALAGSAVAYLGMALAMSVAGLFVWRLALGAVSGFLAAGMALVSVTAPDEERGYALGLMQSVIPAAGLVGPVFGGVLADLIGYRAIFGLVAAVCLLGGVLAALFLTEPRSSVHVGQRVSVGRNLQTAWRHHGLRGALLAIVVSQSLTTTLQPIFVLLVEDLGVEAKLLSTSTGALFAATGLTALVAGPWWGRRGDRIGYGRAVRVALVGAALAMAAQGATTHVWQLAGLRLVYGAFVAGILPALFGFVTAVSPPEHRGGVMGLCSSATMLGNLLGPLAGGYVASQTGVRSVFVVSAVLLLGVTLLARARQSAPAASRPPGGHA
ncbi:MFS transporter [Candidatus Binatia bacterium]|nr:MFS transporter [Candidatus Binatia bacterium]